MNIKRVLIVDDNTMIHELFKEYLESQGLKADIASNGQEGIEKYRECKPDVVLMDMQMPVMNGYEASKNIKHLDPKAKIYVVTGFPDDPLVVKTLAEGYVQTVIPKPCNLTTLFQKLQSTLSPEYTSIK